MIAQEVTSRKWSCIGLALIEQMEGIQTSRGFCLEGCSAPRVVLFVATVVQNLAPMNQAIKTPAGPHVGRKALGVLFGPDG